MANIPQILLDTLQNLREKDLKLFQWQLTSGVQGFKSIPKALLENADRLDTVDKMLANHEVRGAVVITLAILTKINQNQLAEELRINLRERSNIHEEVTRNHPVASSTATQTEDSSSIFTADGEQYNVISLWKNAVNLTGQIINQANINAERNMPSTSQEYPQQSLPPVFAYSLEKPQGYGMG
ncbi:hypothetical protein MHYP_G00092930 [Metynnis hypsauchen]